MNHKEATTLLETAKELNDSLAVDVKIGWEEVGRLVVSDLLAKYKHNVEMKNDYWCQVFRQTLSYYLSEDELILLLGEKNE